jgi:DNA repair protein RadC
VSIADWPLDQRPREKLLKHGAERLSDAELLSLFLRTGTPGKDAVQVGQELLNAFGGVVGLFSASLEALGRIKGLGAAKQVQVIALREMATRILFGEMLVKQPLASPQSVRDYLRLSLLGREREVFVVVFLDAQNQVIDMEEIFMGTLTQTSVYPREVVRRALARNAAAVIFAHNHPSGTPEPSKSDESLTHLLKEALQLVDVRVLDHFIVAGNRIVSFAERGMI